MYASRQVAVVYCVHISQNGEVDLVVDTADSGRHVVAARQDFTSQILAYREQARTAIKNLVAQLARNRTELSTEVRHNCIELLLFYISNAINSMVYSFMQQDKEEICVQYQLLEDIDNRIITLRIEG